MDLPSCQALDFFCKFLKTKYLRDKLIPYAVLLSFLIVFSIACGKQKAQVKPPLPPKPPSAPTAKTEPPVRKEQPAESRPAPRAENKTAPRPVLEPVVPAPEPVISTVDFVPGPLIKIGLATDAREIRISSPGDYYVMAKTAEASRQLTQGDIRVRVEQEASDSSTVFRVQVASYVKMDLAQDLKRRLSESLNQPVIIHENEAAGLNQVWVGEFPSKGDAQSLLDSLVESGFPDAFIVKEAVETEGGRTDLALRGARSLFLLSETGFLIQPSSRASFLSLDGKPYRGVLDVSLNQNNRMTIVNQLGMEEYLQGVVPAEMSPASYPEAAALAALSIAARTYALKNMGKYRSQGFDLSNDTRSQVYGGVAAEKDAASEAVRQTAGLAIYYQDKLIDAMYHSTCGGRTEDFASVFDSAEVPYLKSVSCTIERGPEMGETVLFGKHDLEQIILADDGSVANRNLELARILGIIQPRSEISQEFLTGRADRSEILAWIANAGKLAQKAQPGDGSAALDVETRAGFFQYAAEALFGVAEIKRKMSPRDVEYYLSNLQDGTDIPERARPALSYLIQSGLWRPRADNTVRPHEPVRRADALSLLLRWVESVRPEMLRKGTFVSAGKADGEAESEPSITLKWGTRTQKFRLSDNPYLFRLDPERATPVSQLRIIGNEKVSFHVDLQGRIDFLEFELSPTGASSDRYSPAASWDVTLSRSAMADKLRSLMGNIGEFRDLKPHKIGESGRAVQIQITGSRGSVVVNGYKFRNALGLRDTLFTLTREHNPDGSIESFTFHGRGYGHGVGMCQVGAFGMARAGRSYEEIIKAYYQGVSIRKAY